MNPFGLPLMTVLLIIWAVLTATLVLLLIYRSIVEMHEDDQLFLHEGETHMRQDQVATLTRLRKMRPYIRALSAASISLIVVIAGMKVYQDLMLRY
jgi:hypothetical protein